MYKMQKDLVGETSGMEVNIMKDLKTTKFRPSYKSIEIK